VAAGEEKEVLQLAIDQAELPLAALSSAYAGVALRGFDSARGKSWGVSLGCLLERLKQAGRIERTEVWIAAGQALSQEDVEAKESAM